VQQTAINKGTLIRWTKGFDIKEMVGTDICEGLQNAIDKRNLPVHVAALVNDTVGTLMTRAYTNPMGGRTLVGAIFGTGTNGAYSEQIKRITKFDAKSHPEVTSKIMVINTEWGSFDNDLEVMPNNRFDIDLNRHTPNVDQHMFEKRVSGMFLGELLRLAVLELYNEGFLFKGKHPSASLTTPWSIDTSVPSFIDADKSAHLSEAEEQIRQAFGCNTSKEERKAIQLIVKAIGRRSAHLSAVPFAGLILHTRALDKFDKVDLGADGSVVEFYPNFENMMREALRKTKIGKEESRISLGIAKDGSGVGAALCALVA
jgi:hexokinase